MHCPRHAVGRCIKFSKQKLGSLRAGGVEGHRKVGGLVSFTRKDNLPSEPFAQRLPPMLRLLLALKECGTQSQD